MTHQEILTLERAIAKAVKGGFPVGGMGDATAPLSSYGYIFNHDFAKALWGIDPGVVTSSDPLLMTDRWVRHLQQMVVAEDPIVYLGGNI